MHRAPDSAAGQRVWATVEPTPEIPEVWWPFASGEILPRGAAPGGSMVETPPNKSEAVQERSNTILIAIARYHGAAHKLLRGPRRHAAPVAIHRIHDHALGAGRGEHLRNVRPPQPVK